MKHYWVIQIVLNNKLNEANFETLTWSTILLNRVQIMDSWVLYLMLLITISAYRSQLINDLSLELYIMKYVYAVYFLGVHLRNECLLPTPSEKLETFSL